MLVSLFPNSSLAERYLEERSNFNAKVLKTVKTVVKGPESGSGVNSVSQNTSTTNITEPKVSSGEVKSIRSSVRDTENQGVATSSDISDKTSKFHVVKESENLYRISLLYNIRMSNLQKWNNLDNTGAIIAGQKLWLVPPSMQGE